jgi:hypothetical protein
MKSWQGLRRVGFLFAGIQQKSERIKGVAIDLTDFRSAIGKIQFPLSMYKHFPTSITEIARH